MPNMNEINIFWFRRDLRLADNRSLYHALKADLPLLPIFIFDNNILDDLPPDDARVTFIYDSLAKINCKLSEYNSSILFFNSTPLQAWEELLGKYRVRNVYFNNDYEPYARERDELIKKMLESKGVAAHQFKDHVIFEKEEIVKSDGKPYTVYTPYMKRWMLHLTEDELQIAYSHDKLGNLYTADYKMPSLDQLGFKRSDIEVLPYNLSDELLLRYETERDFPNKNAVTNLGPHLRFGTVSIREAVRRVMQSSEKLLQELAWRDFFQQIMYHFPHTEKKCFREKYEQLPWLNDERAFTAWKKGETGYPIIDAAMKELSHTGYMHNRMRMLSASFLTKHLLTDWRLGERWFAEKLLDYDSASNVGNWQWAAGTGCDAAPYFRIFNPITQQKKFDPNFEYVRKWIPGFRPDDYIKPIVEHNAARERALLSYKSIL